MDRSDRPAQRRSREQREKPPTAQEQQPTRAKRRLPHAHQKARASAPSAVPPPSPEPAPRPMSVASFLTPGQMFSGSQTVNNAPHAPASPSQRENDEWRVNVTIQGLDLRQATVCGSMEALDVPKADSPVVTFWTGEIVDNVHFFFRTRRWGAHLAKDVEHWARFQAFAPFHQAVAKDNADGINLASNRYVFMRWKEIFFASPGDDPSNNCGLTIAGFYYLCMDRHTGAILGYYFDRNCQPFQRLQLNAVPSTTGFSFPDYSFN